MIIGLSGYAQSGKDTVGAMLVERRGYERKAFADILRKCVYALNPIADMSMLDGGSDRVRELVDFEGWESAKTKYPEIRALLQRMGTEVGRHLLGENVWVDALMRTLEPNVNYVITDVRFPNEAEAIWGAGGWMWRIVRPGCAPVNGHPSETAIDDLDFDELILNSRSLDDLTTTVDACVPTRNRKIPVTGWSRFEIHERDFQEWARRQRELAKVDL